MVVPVSASTHGTAPRERGCFNCEIDTQDVIGDDCEREYPFQHHVLRAWGATLQVVTNPLVVSECTAPERGICEIGSLGLANLSHLILVDSTSPGGGLQTSHDGSRGYHHYPFLW